MGACILTRRAVSVSDAEEERTHAEHQGDCDRYVYRLRMIAFAHVGAVLVASATIASAQATRASLDFDGDGNADLTYIRATTLEWKTLGSDSGFTTNTTFQWGVRGDKPAPGDYDGDGIADRAVYRDGYFFSPVFGSGAFFRVSMGAISAGASPVQADYDGDGRTDPAVYRPASGLWNVRLSTTGYTARPSSSFSGACPATCRCPATTTATAALNPRSIVHRIERGTCCRRARAGRRRSPSASA